MALAAARWGMNDPFMTSLDGQKKTFMTSLEQSGNAAFHAVHTDACAHSTVSFSYFSLLLLSTFQVESAFPRESHSLGILEGFFRDSLRYQGLSRGSSGY